MIRRTWAIPIVVLALVFGNLAPARAAQTIIVQPSQGIAGSSASVSGTGWTAGEVAIYWDVSSGTPLQLADVLKDGSFQAQITVPAKATPGDHIILACDVQQACASAKFAVTLPPTPKPTSKPTPRPTAKATPRATATTSPGPSVIATPTTGPGPSLSPGTLRFVQPVPGAGVIGAGILGGPATLQIPGAEIPVEGFQPRCEPPPQATVIDFDDVAPGTDIREQYAELGVHFSASDINGTADLIDRDYPILTYDATTGGTISAPNAIVVADDPTLVGRSEALHVRLDSPQRLIGVYVGNPYPRIDSVQLRMPGRSSGISPDPLVDAIQINGPAAITTCMLILLPLDDSTTEFWVGTRGGIAPLHVDRIFFSDDPTYVVPTVTGGDVWLFEPDGESVEVSGPITLTGFATADHRPADPTFRQVDRVLVTYRDVDGATLNRYAEVIPPTPTRGASSWRLEGVRLPVGPIRVSMFASGTGVAAIGTADLNGFTLDDRRHEVEGTFDLQPIGFEVTQGIRGPIAPMAPGEVAREVAVHVAGKATTVRAFGDVVWGPAGPPPGVTTIPTDALLYGSVRGRALEGSPLRAYNPVVELSAGTGDPAMTLNRLRARADLTWNFELPLSWTAAGSIDLMLWINPPGSTHWTEGGPDFGRNLSWLRAVPFQTIDARDVIIYSTDYFWRRDGPVQHAQATLSELAEAIGYLEQAFPLPYGGANITEFHVKRWAQVPCDGVDLVDPFVDSCSRPAVDGVPVWDTGIIIAEQAEAVTRVGELFMPLLFSPASPIGCSGQAGIGGTPLFHAGACGSTVAQEAAHSLSLIHLSGAHREQGAWRERAPDDHGGLEAGAMGWDVELRQPISPTRTDGTHIHDFMSYGGGAGIWVSIDTWDRVAAALQAANPTSPRDGLGITAVGSAPVPGSSGTPSSFGGSDDLVLASVTNRTGTSTLVSGRASAGGQIVIGSPSAIDEQVDLSPIIRSPYGFGGVVPPGRSLRFDAQVPGAGANVSYTWLLDGTAMDLGDPSGAPTIFVANLTPTRHVLELRVSDGTRSGSASVLIVAGPDTDADGLADAWETSVGMDPRLADDPGIDADADGLPAWLEQSIGSDPRLLDTDGDRYADGVEYEGGSDPADAASLPQALHGHVGEPVPTIGAVASDPPSLILIAIGIGGALALVALVVGLLLRQRRKV